MGETGRTTSATRRTRTLRGVSLILVALIAASELGARTDDGDQTQQPTPPRGTQTDPCPATLKQPLDDYLKPGQASQLLTDINDPAGTAFGKEPIGWNRPGCDGAKKAKDCARRHCGDCGGACFSDLTHDKLGDDEGHNPKVAKMVLGANPAIERIGPGTLPNDGVVLARIDYAGGARDAFYRIGDARTHLLGAVDLYPDQRVERFYLVGETALDMNQKPLPGLAHWRLIAVRVENLVEIRDGYWHACPVVHQDVPTNLDPIAFLPCKNEAAYRALSQQETVQWSLGVTTAADAFNTLARGAQPISAKRIRADSWRERRRCKSTR